MAQLDEYPLRPLQCPNQHIDSVGHRYWNGNDCMILGYMQSQMFSVETQHIAACTTLVEAYQILCICHEKRSGLTRLQLIQQLMQITFDDNAEKFDNAMMTFHNLVYQIKNISHININWLGLPFLLLNLKSSHPTVHDALAPFLMDGSITVELMENHMHYYFEMCNTHMNQNFIPSSSLALLAHLPP